MKRRLILALAVLLPTALVLAGQMTDRLPTQTRTIPVNSSTATALKTQNTIESEALGAAVDANTITFGASGSSTNDVYNGLIVKLSGSGSCADNNNVVRLITDYTGSNKRADLDSDTSATAADPNCTYVVGPALWPQCRNFCIGGASGTIYFSNRVGGTAGTDRVTLTGSSWYCVPDPQKMNYIEVLSASATDTVQTVCH